jgi:hypothetical protein
MSKKWGNHWNYRLDSGMGFLTMRIGVDSSIDCANNIVKLLGKASDTGVKAVIPPSQMDNFPCFLRQRQ